NTMPKPSKSMKTTAKIIARLPPCERSVRLDEVVTFVTRETKRGKRNLYEKPANECPRALSSTFDQKKLFISIRPPSPSNQTRSRVKTLGSQATARVAECVLPNALRPES